MKIPIKPKFDPNKHDLKHNKKNTKISEELISPKASLATYSGI